MIDSEQNVSPYIHSIREEFRVLGLNERISVQRKDKLKCNFAQCDLSKRHAITKLEDPARLALEGERC